MSRNIIGYEPSEQKSYILSDLDYMIMSLHPPLNSNDQYNMGEHGGMLSDVGVEKIGKLCLDLGANNEKEIKRN